MVDVFALIIMWIMCMFLVFIWDRAFEKKKEAYK